MKEKTSLLCSRSKEYLNDPAILEMKDHSIVDGTGYEPLALLREAFLLR